MKTFEIVESHNIDYPKSWMPYIKIICQEIDEYLNECKTEYLRDRNDLAFEINAKIATKEHTLILIGFSEKHQSFFVSKYFHYFLDDILVAMEMK